MGDHDNKPLSASRIKTLQTCSWQYWCKYHLKLPDRSNEGSLRGTICHAIFDKYYINILCNGKNVFWGYYIIERICI